MPDGPGRGHADRTRATPHTALKLGLVVGAIALGAIAGRWLYRPSFEPVAPGPSRQLDAPLEALVERARSQVRQHPRSARHHGELGLVYEANGLWEEARACYEQATSLAPSDPTWRYRLALTLQWTSDLERARRELGTLVAGHPEHALAWSRLGLHRLEAGQLDEAESAFQKAIEREPRLAAALVGLGQIRLARGDARGALETLRQAQRLEPSDRVAHYASGLALRSLGQEDEALVELHRGRGAAGLQLPDPQAAELRDLVRDVPGQLRVALELLEAGRADAAVAYLERATGEHPANLDLRINLAIAVMHLDRLDEARRLLESVVAEDRAKQQAYANLGACLFRLGQLEPALAALDRAVELAPFAAPSHLNRGLVLLGLGQEREARLAFERAVSLSPENTAARLMLAAALARQGLVAEARAELGRAHEVDPASLDVLLGLTELAIAAGDPRAAEAALAAAQRLDPDSARLTQLAATLRAQAAP